MDYARIVLQYLKVVLSPQVITGVVTIVFALLFKSDIRALIGRIAKIRFPGGGEVSVSQNERTSIEASGDESIPPTPPDEKITLPQGLNLSPAQVTLFEQAFQAERAKAYLWEYRYLNYYLVIQTQRVLDWLASLKTRTSVSFFDTLWMPIIPDAQERQAIIRALESHHLIQLSGEMIDVTPKGREYIQWRGPLPDWKKF